MAFPIPSPHFSTDNKGKRKAEADPEEQSAPENHTILKRVKLDNGVHRISLSCWFMLAKMLSVLSHRRAGQPVTLRRLVALVNGLIYSY